MTLRWRASRWTPLTWRLYWMGSLKLGDCLGIVQPMSDICPDCHAEVDVEYVDVGFGGDRDHGVQASPMHCPRCEGHEVGKGDWESTPLGARLPKVVVRLAGQVRAPRKGSNFEVDAYKTVCVGSDSKTLRRRVYQEVVALKAAEVERELTK